RGGRPAADPAGRGEGGQGVPAARCPGCRAPDSEHLESIAMTEKHAVNPRGFLTTAGAATGAAMAAGAFPHPAIGAVKGANEKLNIAVLGSGGRAQEHLRILHRNMKKRESKPVDIIGICDVWDGNDEVKRGLYYSAKL